MLTEKAIPLLLLIFIALAAYASISLSLKNLQQEYPVREGNQKMLAEREYLQLAAATTSGRFKLMEEVSVQNSRAAHDRCHLNNVLLKLLERGETGIAAALLQSQNQATPIISKVYCENPAVCHEISVCQEQILSEYQFFKCKNESFKCEDSFFLFLVVSSWLKVAEESTCFSCKGV